MSCSEVLELLWLLLSGLGGIMGSGSLLACGSVWLCALVLVCVSGWLSLRMLGCCLINVSLNTINAWVAAVSCTVVLGLALSLG